MPRADSLDLHLIDFAAEIRSPRLNCLERIVHETVAVGRYVLDVQPGTLFGSSQITVAVCDGDTAGFSWRFPEEDGVHDQSIGAGDVFINAAHRPIRLEWAGSWPFLLIALERTFVERTLAEVIDLDESSLYTRMGASDPVIAALAQIWRQELKGVGAGGRLFCESLAVALIIHLFRVHGDGMTPLRPVSGGLGANRLRRVNDYIETHLDEEIGLHNLAGIANLSIPHFGKAFKISTGRAPHQYLMDRRIHRAKELLLTTSLSITEIALCVGFSTPSHFSVNFHKVTGLTPSRFRLEIK